MSILPGMLGAFIAVALVTSMNARARQSKAEPVDGGFRVAWPVSSRRGMLVLAAIILIAAGGVLVSAFDRWPVSAFTGLLGMAFLAAAREYRRHFVFNDSGVTVHSPWNKNPLRMEWTDVTRLHRRMFGTGEVIIESPRHTLKLNASMVGVWDLVACAAAHVSPDKVDEYVVNALADAGRATPPPAPSQDDAPPETHAVGSLASGAVAPSPVRVRNVPRQDGARWAGAVLVANALVALMDLVLTGVESGMPPNPVAMLIDAAIGGALLSGRRSLLGLARLRVVLGAVVFSLMHAGKADWSSLAVQVLLSGSLMFLLWGHGERLVRAAASVGLGLIAIMGLAVAGPFNPLARVNQYVDGARPAGSMVLSGQEPAWTMAVPNGWWQWHAGSSLNLHGGDVMLSLPDDDTYAKVIPEALEDDTEVDLQRFADVVVKHQREAVSQFEELGREPFHDGLILRTAGRVDGSRIEYAIYLRSWPGGAVQVFAWSTPARLKAQDARIREVFRAFTPAAATP